MLLISIGTKKDPDRFTNPEIPGLGGPNPGIMRKFTECMPICLKAPIGQLEDVHAW